MAASLSCIFSCTLASLLSPFLGSLFLRFCSEIVSAFPFGLGRFVLGLLICSGCSCKTGQNAVRFCFLLFAWVRSVLGWCPKKGTDNRTERTPCCSGRYSAFFFLIGFCLSEGTIKNSEGSFLCYGWLFGFFFSEVVGSVL